MSTLRFGVTVIPTVSPRRDPVAEAQHAESLGFDLVTVWDHLPGDRPSFETWTLLTWMAARTERIGLATNVLGLPYRPPAVTAKMAESLQRLSGGRFTLGLGAGGSNQEFRMMGVPVRTPGEKVEALEEALRIIRGMWTSDDVTVEGKHYQVEHGRIEPKPDPPIPIWIGAYGPRAVALTGRYADGWLPSYPYMPPEIAVERWSDLRRAAEDAGRDPESLTWAYNVPVVVGDSAGPGDVISGSPDQIAERLSELAKLGVSVFNVWTRGDHATQREALVQVALSLRQA